MKRYIHAFSVTLSIYFLVGFALMYHTALIEKVTSANLTKEVMTISLYEPKKVEPMPLPEPTPPTPPPTHTPKKSVTKKVPKVLENTSLTKEPMVVSQKSEETDMEKPTIAKEVKAEVSSSEASSKEALHVKQKEYLENIKRRINEHKMYPKMAQSSHIEGKVMIEFTISPKGELLSFVVLEGKKIFHKATEDAVQKSFPFPLNEDLFTSVMTFQIELSYSLL